MKRVLVIGSGGAGKSTFAKRLGERTGLPVVHLDAIYWKPGWVETPREEWQAVVDRLVRQEAWIIDGNFGGTMDRRLTLADTVIFLDISRWICSWRVLKRRVRFHGRARPDMAGGCVEQLDFEFLRWIWTYPKGKKPEILQRLDAASSDKDIVVLKSPAEVARFLAAQRGSGFTPGS